MAKDPATLLNWNNLSNSEKRRERLRQARLLGTHTKDEWAEMLEFFEYTCCCCLGEFQGLRGVVKDHIIPVYQGGSDSIKNIQPLCNHCNSSKGPNNSDWRPQLADSLKKELPIKWQNNG